MAATCSSCHGTHKILSHTNPESRTYRTNIPATCGACHAGPEAQYLGGVHGKAMQAGNMQAPVCSDCHTAHQISNVRLTSWQVRTTATCSNCHRERYATYHDTFHAQVSALGYVETARFMNLLLLIVLGFFVLHTILWFIRSTLDRRTARYAAGSDESRQN